MICDGQTSVELTMYLWNLSMDRHRVELNIEFDDGQTRIELNKKFVDGKTAY